MAVLRRVESRVGRALLAFLGFLLATLIVAQLLGIANSNLIWGEDNQYGRVPIPGAEVVHLPSGDVQASVAAALPGRGNETPELAVPRNLSLSVTPASGSGEPTITRDIGSSVNANDDKVDTQRPVWKVNVPADGDYRVKVQGSFVGFGVNPQLWLGYEPGFLHGADIWLAAAVIVLLIGLVWFIVARRKPASSPE